MLNAFDYFKKAQFIILKTPLFHLTPNHLLQESGSCEDQATLI